MIPTPRPEFRPADLLEMEVDAAVAAVVRRASELRSSDLYLLTEEKSLSISVRRLGTIERLAVVPHSKGRQMISHVKAMAGMNISEHRRPMDGRWIHDFDGLVVDMRVNTIATLFGEDMTLRMWNRDAGLFSLDRLGLSKSEMGKLTTMLTRPSGLVLVTGPTGTGKTTTLYACLQYLNDGRRKLNTLEDPVEYALDGVRQSQVNPAVGLDFPELLRNVLRQAPDVIMVGEIRDEETATTAVRAANSGHLVLATLHAPTASGAVQSMLALGSLPYYLSSCLQGVIAQRLLRTLCEHCRVRYDISDSPQTFADIQSLLEPGQGHAIYGPRGCEKCFHAGYDGRTGLFEIMALNQELRRLIAAARPSHEIAAAAMRAGMVEFRRGALWRVALGITSTEEVLRDIPAEHLGLEE